MLEEGSARIVAAIYSREISKISITEVLVTGANAKLTILKNQIIENSENLNRLRKETEKIND